MKLWIVTYTHRHGIDTWPRFRDEPPSEDKEIANMGEDTWEGPEFGDFLDITGPFEVPKET